MENNSEAHLAQDAPHDHSKCSGHGHGKNDKMTFAKFMGTLTSKPLNFGMYQRLGVEAFFAINSFALCSFHTNLCSFGGFPEGANITNLVLNLDFDAFSTLSTV